MLKRLQAMSLREELYASGKMPVFVPTKARQLLKKTKKSEINTVLAHFYYTFVVLTSRLEA